MTDLAIQPDRTSTRAANLAQPRSYLARLVLDVVGRSGARLGLAWSAVLVLLAVFAPLLASSHPILWKHNGVTSSPMLVHLTPPDVILFVGFFAAIVAVLLRRASVKSRVLAWVAATGLAAVLAVVLMDPPEVVVLSQYREAADAGEVDWAWLAPIPYSPSDRLPDVLGRTGQDPRLLTPSPAHWMGTTAAGADVASRMIHACRIALAIGLIATGISATIGIVVGGVLGYFSGAVDLFGMRLVEVFAAIPTIFLLIMVVAVYEPNLYLMMLILGLTGWIGFALFVRAEFLKLRQQDFVTAARAGAIPLHSILFRHMLPNGISPVLVLASFGIASAILIESTLSFLGLGPVETPSWGQMLQQARSAQSQWGLVVFPGLAIFLTVFAYNLIGEAMRDAIDPHTQKAA